MKATGLFFLRTRPYVATNAAGERAVLLPVAERVKDGPDGPWLTLNQLEAVWRGRAAFAFLDAHRDALVPGRGLVLELDRLRGDAGAWRATVTRLELAPLPPSWQKHAAASGAESQPPQPMAA